MKGFVSFIKFLLFATTLAFSSLEFVLADQLIKLPQGSEQVSQILVTTGTQVRHQIFSQCLPIQLGKTVDIRVKTELTNNLGYNVGVGYSILVWDYGKNGLIRYYDLSHPMMTNVTPDTHHLIIETNELENPQPVAGVSTRCYTLSVYAVSSSAPSNNSAYLLVEKNYGNLIIAIR